MSNRGRRPEWFDMKDECDGINPKDFEKIQRGIKKTQKKIRKGKHIYFNEEWNRI